MPFTINGADRSAHQTASVPECLISNLDRFLACDGHIRRSRTRYPRPENGATSPGLGPAQGCLFLQPRLTRWYRDGSTQHSQTEVPPQDPVTT
jgi:hypothetical protein